MARGSIGHRLGTGLGAKNPVGFDGKWVHKPAKPVASTSVVPVQKPEFVDGKWTGTPSKQKYKIEKETVNESNSSST